MLLREYSVVSIIFFALLTESGPDRQIRYLLILLPNVADPRCLSRIPDPDFSIPNPGPKRFPDPGPGSASKNLSIFHPKIVSKALGNMIQDVHPGSRIRILIFYLSLLTPTPPAPRYLDCCSREPLRVALDTGGEGDARDSE